MSVSPGGTRCTTAAPQLAQNFIDQVAERRELRVRLEAAVEVLNELGGMAELGDENGVYIIRGFSCPLAAVVPGHPEACSLAEALVTELAGVPVREQCERGERPCCRFMVTAT